MDVNKILTTKEALGNLERIASVLRSGGVVAVPTDTIYGVACLACNKSALDKIYSMKGRDLAKPLALAVGKVTDLIKWSEVTLNPIQLSMLLPGPVTLVFDRKPSLPAELNPLNNESIGIRIPDCQFMIELAQYLDEPIALTSANISNHPSSLEIQEFTPLWNSLDLIVDGGRICSSSKAGSTVIDLTRKGYFNIIREGGEYEKVLEALTRSCGLKKIDSDANNNSTE